MAGYAHIVEDDLGGVTGLDAVLLVLLPLGETSGAGRDDEAGVTLRPELGVDHGDDDVDISHATVGDPGLRAVEDPFVLGLVVLGGEPVAVDVGPGVWLRGGERTRVDLGAVAVALRHPLHDLLWGAGSGDAGGGETGAHDRHADTGVTPEDLLDRHDHGDAGGVVHHHLGHELPAVETDLGSLLDDRPRELFSFVPLFGIGTHDIDRELVQPLLQRELVFVQRKGEIGHRRLLCAVRPGVTDR